MSNSNPVHLSSEMLTGMLRLAVLDQWTDEEINSRVEQFAIATALNNDKTLDEVSLLHVYKDAAVKRRRASMKVVKS